MGARVDDSTTELTVLTGVARSRNAQSFTRVLLGGVVANTPPNPLLTDRARAVRVLNLLDQVSIPRM
jgi:hypothetical protein